jgi:hypothetical protein
MWELAMPVQTQSLISTLQETPFIQSGSEDHHFRPAALQPSKGFRSKQILILSQAM